MGKKKVGTDLLPPGPVNTMDKLERRKRVQELFVQAMLEGDGTPESVIKKLAKGDPKKAKMWRSRWQKWLGEPTFQEMIGVAAKGVKIGGLIPASRALVRRADKGNVPAIKLLYEAVGYWSPRSTMEHTGEVAVVLKGGYRPERVQDDVEIPDADVVEDAEE